MLKDATEDDFLRATCVADQVICNLAILVHDNSLIKAPEERDRKSLRCRPGQLQRLCADDSSSTENMRRKPPEILAVQNRELYFLFVNYITSIIARYLAGCAASESWLVATMAILSKVSMKLKVMEKDPSTFARMSQEAAEDLNDEADQRKMLSFWEKPSSILPKDDKDDNSFKIDQAYHTVEWYIRDTMSYLINYMLCTIVRDFNSPSGADCFEMGTRVYRTGVSSSPVVISSDWDGEFSASSDPQQIRYCRSALDILLLNTRDLAQKVLPTKSMIWVEWDFNSSADLATRPPDLQHKNTDKRKLGITSLDSALSILMPLSLCNAHTAMETWFMIATANLSTVFTGEARAREYPDESFSAQFSFTTASYADAYSKMGTHSGFRSLRDAKALERPILPGHSLERPAEPAEPDWAGFRKQIDTTAAWKVDEARVIVSCARYVWTIMGISVLVVTGGLVVPFCGLVHLPNVDPFNITTFVWLIVAFCLLIAKSRYVPDWAWHDFLRRRIICKTVTELSNVTGLDPQLVIHKLLVSENSSVLGTRGPHNSMFKLQRENGFSIDVPVKTSTLYASGFVLFRCLGKADQHIVCIDVRPVDVSSASLLIAEHRPTQKSFGCSLPASKGDTKSLSNVLKLTERESQGYRVLGLFLADAEFG